MTKVYLEEHGTLIFRRIALALGTELARHGLDVLMVKPGGFTDTSFHQFLSQQPADAIYIANARGNAVMARVPRKGGYFFEAFPGSLVFLHHDAILFGATLLDGISLLQAWQRVAERSVHLCIEPSNITQLNSIGIRRAHLVPHVSEIVPQAPALDGFHYDTTFVGHLVPSACCPRPVDQRTCAFVEEAVRLRRADCSAPLEAVVDRHIGDALDGLGGADDRAVLAVACRRWLRSKLDTLSMRGWMIETCGIDPLVIFGGDPAYLHRVDRRLQVTRPGVSHRPAIERGQDLQQVYNRSRVSLNLSSLQFDHAVVNRFHDVVLSGGLCLTDALSGVADLTSVHGQVSYRTPDELRERTAYFCDPAHARHRADVIRAMQQDIVRNSGYPMVAQILFGALSDLKAATT